ncbi:unnamed protein product [Sphagnum tenellum]
MHILQNAASVGAAAAVNAASRNRLYVVDRQRNYLDRMSTAAQQQQRDCDHERHRQARGATCFEDLRTTHWPHTPTTIVHPTFKDACPAHGLL